MILFTEEVPHFIPTASRCPFRDVHAQADTTLFGVEHLMEDTLDSLLDDIADKDDLFGHAAGCDLLLSIPL